MKLTIKPIRVLSQQDKIDLKKIWPEQDTQEWEVLLAGDQKLFVAQFNGRLLAAVKVTLNSSTGILEDFCVREVTRRRGVGSYLLEQVKAAFPEINRWEWSLNHFPDIHDPALSGFMAACDFRYDAQKNDYYCE
ncbi:aspartate 1-decarboxylase autocleavage activator PanM [Xenorhabdus bovienii]|uniref:PanD regulatory factor n=1 Tax=Xenorhabdus bovienii TaxID=40576 RepID=A0AAJ1J842_XENBV|nr:aspartate 1-decarboxylase autocleavage activator PanM [Xenorhabdus bovienii]MDE1478880.1 aspartate 1-decarboxylase autocleavage activator PanM [Xenorhabdus bovienii]MDE1492196.1 aspartate 1-decarboxylase autocleavage activator PanM [Xenorhabdus bovienii]MDE1494711.1 aspartate 1-decarboxylase autocleavage activator PanM [Xenorhabdus bovienii]MDE9471990.1 aspartate 1-decarboxylase autocleavage activator PanM [Xenorhabdus bovienii]MDE9510596.1 aspartate 1-decarboxylase autocleavage activator P